MLPLCDASLYVPIIHARGQRTATACGTKKRPKQATRKSRGQCATVGCRLFFPLDPPWLWNRTLRTHHVHVISSRWKELPRFLSCTKTSETCTWSKAKESDAMPCCFQKPRSYGQRWMMPGCEATYSAGACSASIHIGPSTSRTKLFCSSQSLSTVR